MADKLSKQLFDKYLQFVNDNNQGQISSLNDDQLFYLSVAFAQPNLMGILNSTVSDEATVNQKVFEMKDRIIGAVTKNLENYDLYQLSQIMAVYSQMTNEQFTRAFENRIYFFIEKFREYKDKNINIQSFLLDMAKNFLAVSFSFQPISDKFITDCAQFFKVQCPSFPEQAIQMVLVAALRAEVRNQQFSKAIINQVLKRELVQNIKVNQISVLAFMAYNSVDNPAVLKAILQNVMVQFTKEEDKPFDPNILSLIAFSFSKLKGPAGDNLTERLYDQLIKKITNIRIQPNISIPFQNISDFILFQQQAQIQNQELAKKILEMLGAIEFDDQALQFGISQFSTLMTYLIQQKMFESQLWKKGCIAIEQRIMNYEVGQFFELFIMCSQLGLGRSEFWTKVRQRINQQISQYREEEILAIHNCLAIEGIYVQPFWDKVKQLTLSFNENKIIQFNDFLSLAWSLTKLQKQTDKKITDLAYWRRFTAALKNRKSIDLNQISQTLIALKQNKYMENEFEEFIQNSILQRCKVEDKSINTTVLQSLILEIQNSNFAKKKELLSVLNSNLK